MKKPVSDLSEWQTVEHTANYLAKAEKLPHRAEAEAALLDQIPPKVTRILDLGTGDGLTLALVKQRHPEAESVGLDFSEPMLLQAKKRFANDQHVKLVMHDFNLPLPASELGCFDAVVSSLAIHHLHHERKRQLYQEVFDLLNPDGVFCNLEHVASPTQRAHLKCLAKVGMTPETEDPSNKTLDVETQLGWLRQIGFVDVDCYWKWLEVALLVGYKP
ncbi:MAG: class I SAM-dependent methyltransferase [Candidatus Bathyarchaeota archaeon]|nr:class I SAM-dependent methyltransferase [Candidatus Bathyarchaeota archaeon]